VTTDSSSSTSNTARPGNNMGARLTRFSRSDSSEDLRDSKLCSPVPEDEARKIFTQIATAILYCHSQNIIHRDIKHKNILFDTAGSVKLIDFGLSNWACGGTMSFCGTPAYASPEMLLGTQYTGPEVDVWSMGILLYSLVTGKLPFVNVIDIIKQNYVIPVEISPECADLIRRCLVIEIPRRATLADIMAHPWMLGQTFPPSINTSNILPTLPINQVSISTTPPTVATTTHITPTQIGSPLIQNFNLRNSNDSSQDSSRNSGFSPLISIFPPGKYLSTSSNTPLTFTTTTSTTFDEKNGGNENNIILPDPPRNSEFPPSLSSLLQPTFTPNIHINEGEIPIIATTNYINNETNNNNNTTTTYTTSYTNINNNNINTL